MTTPQKYTGNDAVKVFCTRDYEVQEGLGDKNTVYKKGKTYQVSPLSAVHLMRKTYRVFADPKPGMKRGKYLGDASYFTDPKAAQDEQDALDAKQKAADKAAADKAAADKAAADKAAADKAAAAK